MPAARILVLFAHPAFERSRVHRRLVAAARARESIQHLERLLAAEFHGIERPDESNWDSDALRSAHPRSEQP